MERCCGKGAACREIREVAKVLYISPLRCLGPHLDLRPSMYTLWCYYYYYQLVGRNRLAARGLYLQSF